LSISPRAAARLRLTRMPLAGTTVADVWAGFFCAGGAVSQPGDVAHLALVHVAAIALYLGGMTLNDAFDAKEDEKKHPERPIPSGVLTRGEAFAQGFALLGIGLAGGFAAGQRTGLVACALAAAIVLYDGVAKRWAAPGALCMGLCRALDVQLGAGWAGAGFWPAVALGAYIFAVTMLSTFEDRPNIDRAKMGRFVFTLLRGIFLVDALSLAAYGHYRVAAAAAALVLTVPLLARAQARLTRPLPAR
jgi:4-hydroxybenzoate polyprenyltransferase